MENILFYVEAILYILVQEFESFSKQFNFDDLIQPHKMLLSDCNPQFLI